MESGKLEYITVSLQSGTVHPETTSMPILTEISAVVMDFWNSTGILSLTIKLKETEKKATVCGNRATSSPGNTTLIFTGRASNLFG